MVNFKNKVTKLIEEFETFIEERLSTTHMARYLYQYSKVLLSTKINTEFGSKRCIKNRCEASLHQFWNFEEFWKKDF